VHGRTLRMSPAAVIAAYNLSLLALVAGLLSLPHAAGRYRNVVSLLVSVTLFSFAVLMGAILLPVPSFGRFQLLTWAAFVHAPMYLLGWAAACIRQRRPLALACVVLAASLVVVGIDAFFIEPRWLAVDHVRIRSPKLGRAVRLVVVADIQTDDPGNYERRVLRRAQSEEPDLILLAGDYVQQADQERYREAANELSRMMEEEGLHAPLGAYAVRGNVDWPGQWEGIFSGLPVSTVDQSDTMDLGPLTLTALSLRASSDTAVSVQGVEGFHVVMGHVPNFARGSVEADLLIAGHTHGGQVQLPLIGPVMTLSDVPRKWASGVTEIAPGKTLIVSRGIGMERGYAPRLRFLCRPQLVIVDLAPA